MTEERKWKRRNVVLIPIPSALRLKTDKVKAFNCQTFDLGVVDGKKKGFQTRRLGTDSEFLPSSFFT